MPLPSAPVPGNSLARAAAAGRTSSSRVIFRRFLGAGRDLAVRSCVAPGEAVTGSEIDQAIAAHPHLVFGLGQFGQHVAAFVVGDDDLDELVGQVGGFGDHPDPGFRPLWAGYRAADASGTILIVASAALACGVAAAIRQVDANKAAMSVALHGFLQLADR